MSAILIDWDYQSLDSNGNPNSAGSLTFYDTGTTTLKTIYSDPALTTALSNPITLDSAGRFSGVVYAATSERYVIVEQDSGGATIRSRDPIWGRSETFETTAASKTALKALDATADQVVTVGGDGQGYAYKFNASSAATADDVLVIAPDSGSGRWELQYSGALPITLWGAVGDGVTNDRVAIQACADSLTTGGKIFIPSGSYMTDAPITITNDGVTIEGCGYSSQIFMQSETDAGILASTSDNVTVRDIRLTGNYVEGTYEPSSSTAYGLLLNPPGSGTVSGGVVENVWFEDMIGRGLDMSGGVIRTKVSGCKFLNIRRIALAIFKQCDGARITENYFYRCGSAIQADDATASDTALTAEPVRDVIVADNVVYECGDDNVGTNEAAMGFSGVERLKVHDNIFYKVGQNTAAGAGTQNMFAIIINNGQAYYTRSTDIDISNNTFRECTNAAILLEGVLGVSVTGNTFTNNYIRDAAVTGAANILMQDDGDSNGCEDISFSGNRHRTGDVAESRTEFAYQWNSTNGSNITVGIDESYVGLDISTYLTAFTGTDAASKGVNILPPVLKRHVVADDAIVEIDTTPYPSNIIRIHTDVNTEYGEAYVRVSPSVAVQKHANSSTNFSVATVGAAPTGSSGTDGALTVFARTDVAGRLYIENRLGSSVEVFVRIEGVN